MEGMEYIPRAVEAELRRQLGRGKSVLLLGPSSSARSAPSSGGGLDSRRW